MKKSHFFCFFLLLCYHSLAFTKDNPVWNDSIFALVNNKPITSFEIEINCLIEKAFTEDIPVEIPYFFEEPYIIKVRNIIIVEYLIKSEVELLNLLSDNKLEEENNTFFNELKNSFGETYEKIKSYYDLTDENIKEILLRKLLVKHYFDIKLSSKFNLSEKELHNYVLAKGLNPGDPEVLKASETEMKRDIFKNNMKTILDEMKEKFNVILLQ